MGTSSSNSGTAGNTPIIPSWVENPVEPADSKHKGKKETIPPSPNREPIPESGDNDRFQAARTSFSKYASSNGGDKRSLKNSLSRYVSHSLSGSRNASKRMAISQVAGTKLINFLTSVSSNGIEKTLESYGLSSLRGRPIDEIFVNLVDHICPSDGSVDVGIARDAYIKTVADLAEADINNLDNLSEEQVKTIFEIFATYTIEARICNDIGTKSISLPTNVEGIIKVQRQLRDFIKGTVAHVINREYKKTKGLTVSKARSLVNKVYQQTFSILETLGDEE